MFLVNKKVGETPLEAMEQVRRESGIVDEKTSMTYAGRLDPMAEGLLIVLAGDECKEKEKYTALDKVYETEIVLGYATDTYDVLGLVRGGDEGWSEVAGAAGNISDISDDFLGKFVGTFKQEYPPYSSKTVAGKPLFQYAREGALDTIEMPTNEVTIFNIEKIGEREVTASELLVDVCGRISKVKGDFRQKEILEKWGETLAGESKYRILKIRVHCSSGTYIRSLAERIGRELGCGAFTLSIKRTRVGRFMLPL